MIDRTRSISNKKCKSLNLSKKFSWDFLTYLFSKIGVSPKKNASKNVVTSDKRDKNAKLIDAQANKAHKTLEFAN